MDRTREDRTKVETARRRCAATIAWTLALECFVASTSCTAILGISEPVDDGVDGGGEDSSSTDLGFEDRSKDSTPIDTRPADTRANDGDVSSVDTSAETSVDTGPADTTPDTPPIDTGFSCTGRADGTVCGSSPRSICRAGVCRVSACGDGFVDSSGGEDCEPPGADGSGCDHDCTFTCNSTAKPAKSCGGSFCAPIGCTAPHVCVAGPGPCVPPVSCKTVSCNESLHTCGSPVLIDGDSDGYGPSSPTPASPCNDCNDADPNVHPTQAAWFTFPSAGSFDYDCSGVVEAEYPTGSCALNTTTGVCELIPGYLGTPPACGTSGDFIDTCIGTPTCATTTTLRTQACH